MTSTESGHVGISLCEMMKLAGNNTSIKEVSYPVSGYSVQYFASNHYRRLHETLITRKGTNFILKLV